MKSQASEPYKCNVKNCGGGDCVHEWYPAMCPYCDRQLLRIKGRDYAFCPDSFGDCMYELKLNKGSE